MQSLRKFLVVRGHRSVWRSSSMSPTLVTIRTDIFAPCRRQANRGGGCGAGGGARRRREFVGAGGWRGFGRRRSAAEEGTP